MDDLGFELRKASLADAAAIAALTDAAYAKYVPRLGRKPHPMTIDYADVFADHTVWLLCDGAAPVGAVTLKNEPDAMLVYSVAVHPAYQRRGLGRRLLALAEQEALAAGYSEIRLFTNALMDENLRLYDRLGYRETSREPYLDSARVNMSKQLNR